MNRHALNSFLHSIGEAITPILKASKFKETGKVTPEEFVAAGDFIVHTCPTWAWQAGDAKRTRSALPTDKQFLCTRSVPCHKRCSDMKYSLDDEEMVSGGVGEGDGCGVGDNEGWVATHISADRDNGTEDDVVEDIPNEIITGMAETTLSPTMEARAHTGSDDGDESSDSGDDDSIPDMADFEEENLYEDDPGAITVEESDDNILKTRTYDLHITYDLYYQTPRLFLFGYDENRNPLTVDEMFEDISAEHAQKTITMEQHPHLPFQMASIHPCKHASVMKKLITTAAGNGKDSQVYLYIMIFLKFVQSVIPTIEYDFTREFSVA